jgi:hypothetical protein
MALWYFPLAQSHPQLHLNQRWQAQQEQLPLELLAQQAQLSLRLQEQQKVPQSHPQLPVVPVAVIPAVLATVD